MNQEFREGLINNGVDLDTTMDRFMGNEELYIKFLKRFPKDENFSQLKGCIENRNYEEAFKHAHTLKGVTANLGLNSLYEVLNRIVEKLRGNQTGGIDNDFTTLEVHYESICKLIEEEQL